MNFNIETTTIGHDAIVVLREDNLDAGNVKAFKDAIQPILEEHNTVMLDMSGVNFVDSSGLGVLLSCLRTMNNKQGQFKLVGLTKPVQALFELVRMHRIFTIYRTREEALSPA